MDGLRLRDVLDFIFMTVLFRYICLPWLGKLLAVCFKRLFLKTEQEISIWLHFKNNRSK